MRPNLFLIGAMKSGSTTLHELLACHPQIAMTEPKEPCRFVEGSDLRTHWPEMWAKGYWRDESKYLALFPRKLQARWFGESSTDYTKRPLLDGVADRIAAAAPDARFVYIVRDPVERTISHYWHMVELRGEKRAPLDAIVQDRHYTDVSHYAFQLAPYLERFGRDRLHVLTFDELKRDPQAAVAAIFRWLGVDADFVPDELTAAHNVTPDAVRQKRAGSGWLDRLRHSDAWTALGPHVPPALRRMGMAMVEKNVERRSVDMDPVVAHLRPLQREQTLALQQQLGRRFDDWRLLWGTRA